MNTSISTNEITSNSKVILLAGAGASAHLQMPTLDDLLKRAIIGNDDIADRIRDTRNSIHSDPNRYRSAVFEELIAKIREYIRIIICLKADHTLRQSLPNLPHEIENGMAEQKWKAALTRCYRVLLEEYGPNRIKTESDGFGFTIQYFKSLAEHNNGDLHIYTTNYDCSYQVLASNTDELEFFTHIDNQNGRFRDAWISSRPELSNAGLPQIYVHRLHGCVAWYFDCAEEGNLWSSCGTIEEVYGAGKELIINEEAYLHNMCIKLIASQLVGTNPVFSSAFDELDTHLKECRTLLVWGYSFRDLEVLRLINQAVSTRRDILNIAYIDPYLPEGTAIQNIRKTFHSIPIQVSRKLTPRRIEWLPSQGYDKLISATIRTILAGDAR